MGAVGGENCSSVDGARVGGLAIGKPIPIGAVRRSKLFGWCMCGDMEDAPPPRAPRPGGPD